MLLINSGPIFSEYLPTPRELFSKRNLRNREPAWHWFISSCVLACPCRWFKTKQIPLKKEFPGQGSPSSLLCQYWFPCQSSNCWKQPLKWWWREQDRFCKYLLSCMEDLGLNQCRSPSFSCGEGKILLWTVNIFPGGDKVSFQQRSQKLVHRFTIDYLYSDSQSSPLVIAIWFSHQIIRV